MSDNSESRRVVQSSKRVAHMESTMETEPMIVDVQLNDVSYEEALVDTGNTCYITINERTVRKLQLPTQELMIPRNVQGVSQGMDEKITQITWAKLDI
ncbi:hypothetical protein GcM3_005045, partial [Golovinomyces cichoracearum]